MFLNHLAYGLNFPPLSLPDERGLADAGELDDLCVGMVIEQRHRVVKLLGVELGRAAFAEIRVGRARDGLAFLRALHDHVALELRERQQHIAKKRVDRVVGQDAEVQYVDGDALVDHLGDESGRLRHRPREAVELGNDEHIAAPQMRTQLIPLRPLHPCAGEGVRIDFLRAGGGKRLALRLQTVSVARLLSGRYPYVAEFHVLHLIFLCFDTISFDHNF